ncbi:MAG: Slp family lipoprotein, partial [Gammaproteobacteria bacterium]
PAVYRAGRQVTVYGVLKPPVNRTIGERPYTYPMVRAQKLYLWPDYREYWRNRPYRYDPFYYPYYPYYPYWHRFRFGIHHGW